MMQAKQAIRQIGFLGVPSDFSFDSGQLRCSKQFVEAKRWVDRFTNRDGFLYPPISHTARFNKKSGKYRTVSFSKRPALLHQLPTSHDLVLEGHWTNDAQDSSPARLILLSLAFLYGTRLEFSDWWIDGRIPVRTPNIIHFQKEHTQRFVSQAVHNWLAMSEKIRILVVNALYVYSRAGSLEWDWERFLHEYMVFDACYSIAEAEGRCRSANQKGRFDALCRAYGVKANDSLTKYFVKLRNRLFHQALWDDGQPGTARSGDSFMAPIHLRRLNHKLLAVILSGQSDYTSSAWWYLGNENS